jgi:RHS repeat-associated protein
MDALFKQYSDRYKQLRAQQKTGKISPQDFQAAVQQLRWQDGAGDWWTIDPIKGGFLRHDGSNWVAAKPPSASPAAKSPPKPQQAPAPASPAPKNLAEFFALLLKNILRTLPRQIGFYLIAMAAVWLLNVYVVVFVNNGFSKGDFFTRNYTVQPVSILPGTLFWFFFGMLVSALIGLLSPQRRKALLAGFTAAPGYVRQSLRACQSNAAIFILLGGAVGLILAGLVNNPLVCLTWLMFIVGSLLEQQRSLLATFLRLAWQDGQHLARRGAPVPFSLPVFGVLLIGSGLGLLASLLLPGVFMWIAAVGMVALAVVLFFVQSRGRMPGMPLFSFALGFAALAALTLAKTVLADDGGWSESGGTLQGWLNNPGSIPFLGTSLIPALSIVGGILIGDSLGGVPLDIRIAALASLWGFPTNLGGPEDNPYTRFQGPPTCRRPGGIPSFLVNTATLGLVVQDTIFRGRGFGPHADIELTYNSALLAAGMFGKGWRLRYESSITQIGKVLRLVKGSGQTLEYQSGAGNPQPNAPVVAVPPVGVTDSLTDYGAYWLWLEKDTRRYYRYDKKSPGMACPLTGIADLTGNVLRIAYNPDGTIQSITDPAGRVTQFGYHPNHLCASFTLTDGRTARYSYDPGGCLTQAVDLQGITASYEYDGDGLMQRMSVDRNQKVYAFRYQPVPDGKCIAGVTDPGGGITRYEIVSADPRVVRISDPAGRATTYHSQEGLTTKVVDVSGGIAQIDYAGGLPVRIQDKNGGVRQMAYDARGNLVRFTDPSGAHTSFAYDAQDHRIAQTDALGGTWRYEYGRDHLTRRISPLGQTVTYDYDAHSQLSALTDAGGKKTTLHYDRFGNLTGLTDPTGYTLRIDFDPSGLKPVALTDPRGNITRLEYDHNDRLTKITHPDGAVRLMKYNCCAAVEIVDENGQSWRSRRDALLQIAEQATPLGNQTLFVYDKSQRIVQVVDALKRTQTIAYDDARRTQSRLNLAGQATHYQFDPVGNLALVWDENGKASRYSYDARSLPVQGIDPLGKTVNLEYDPLGRPVKLTNRRGEEVSQVFDAEGRLVQKLHRGVEVSAYQYDLNGTPIGIKDAGGGWTRLTVDALDQVIAVRYPDGLQTGLAYDPNGGLSSLTYPGGLVVQYVCDQRERISRLKWSDQTVNFRYDGAGNLTGITRSNGSESLYRYDAEGNLREIRHTQGGQILAQIGYEYDAVGNIQSESGTYPLAPAPAPAARQVTYDDANQMVTCAGEPCRYDADGNLAAMGGQWQASYDPENRLVDLVRRGQKTHYQYNGTGQRVRVAGPGGARKFHYDPAGRLLAEIGANGQVLAQYIYAGNLLVARVNAAGEVFYYHFNQNGSTLALTNRQGQVVAAYAYAPFGAVVNRSGNDQGNPFTYTGAFGVMDEGDGLFYMRQRYYDALSGRFLQRDPIGIADNLNLYAYVANNPLVWIDPLGQEKANWNLIVGGLGNLAWGVAGEVAGTGMALASLVDPTSLPTIMVRGPVIIGVFSFGVKGTAKGVRQIIEGWQGKPTPEGWFGVRESVLGSLPGVSGVTYLMEGKPMGFAYEGLKEVLPYGTGNIIDVWEAIQPRGESMINCDRGQLWGRSQATPSFGGTPNPLGAFRDPSAPGHFPK